MLAVSVSSSSRSEFMVSRRLVGHNDGKLHQLVILAPAKPGTSLVKHSIFLLVSGSMLAGDRFEGAALLLHNHRLHPHLSRRYLHPLHLLCAGGQAAYRSSFQLLIDLGRAASCSHSVHP